GRGDVGRSAPGGRPGPHARRRDARRRGRRPLLAHRRRARRPHRGRAGARMIARVVCLLARPGAAGAAASVLPVTAFGIVTALLLTVIGGAQTFWTWTD